MTTLQVAIGLASPKIKVKVMKMKILCALLLPLASYAQPFNFKSTGTVKPIELTLAWHNMGKGASVQYKGKSELIALKIKSYQVDSSERASGSPDEDTYRWLEVYKGKVTGEYGVKVMLRSIYEMYYIRYSDRKKFNFEYVEDKGRYDGQDVVLLHGVQFDYNAFYNDGLTIKYSNGTNQNIQLPKLPKEGSRYSIIKDYNADGIDDIAFTYNINKPAKTPVIVFIYDPKTKKFNQKASLLH